MQGSEQRPIKTTHYKPGTIKAKVEHKRTKQQFKAMTCQDIDAYLEQTGMECRRNIPSMLGHDKFARHYRFS